MKTSPALSAFILSLALAASARAQIAPAAITTAIPASQGPSFARGIFPLDAAWSFTRTDVTPATIPALVNLPHDWSIAGPFSADAPSQRGGAYLPTGVAQFR